MNFNDVMQNLAIGIVGGFFSSIIVSIVFYVLTNFQNEMNEAEKLIEPIRKICITWKYQEFLKDSLDINEMIEEYWRKTLYSFKRYSSGKFDNRLSGILSDIRDISLKTENIKAIHEKDFDNYVKQLSRQLESYELYKKDFPKNYIIRILKNKVLWIVLFISIIIFIVA
nr:MAG TPA: hypothetical protein [Caudoviricetes sp.]